jgi:hypothetical protein
MSKVVTAKNQRMKEIDGSDDLEEEIVVSMNPIMTKSEAGVKFKVLLLADESKNRQRLDF